MVPTHIFRRIYLCSKLSKKNNGNRNKAAKRSSIRLFGLDKFVFQQIPHISYLRRISFFIFFLLYQFLFEFLMSSLPVKMNAPIFKSSTIVELQEKLKINKVFHKSLSEDTVKDVQALIQYWNMKHALNVSSTSFDNSKNSRFFKTGNKIEPQEFSDVISNSIQPNKEQLAACTGIYELPSTCLETSSVKSSSDIRSYESSKHPSSTFIECSDIEPACSDNAEPTHSSSEEHSPSTESETTADPSSKKKALKAKVQTFFSKIKNAFAKRSSKAPQRSFSCVDPISGPIDLSDSEYLEFVFVSFIRKIIIILFTSYITI